MMKCGFEFSIDGGSVFLYEDWNYVLPDPEEIIEKADKIFKDPKYFSPEYIEVFLPTNNPRSGEQASFCIKSNEDQKAILKRINNFYYDMMKDFFWEADFYFRKIDTLFYGKEKWSKDFSAHNIQIGTLRINIDAILAEKKIMTIPKEDLIESDENNLADMKSHEKISLGCVKCNDYITFAGGYKCDCCDVPTCQVDFKDKKVNKTDEPS